MADVRKELSFCKKVNVPVIGVVENMSGFAAPVYRATNGGGTPRFATGTTTDTSKENDERADSSESLTQKIRAVIEAHCLETGADPNTAFLETDVFAPTRGGAEKMCADFSVPFLGRVPLDPAIAAAAERGASVFDEDSFEKGAAFAAVRAVVNRVRAAVGEA
jgi:Mrp family chromosome partitioning ATPase